MTLDRPVIMMPIETAARELQGKVLLAHALCKRGCEVVIGSKAKIRAALSVIDNPVYIDKGYHEGPSDELYAAVRGRGGLVVSLDEENGIDYEDSFNTLRRFPEKAFGLYDLIFLWGQSQFDLLKKNRHTFRDDRVFVSGHPKFQLFDPKYATLFETARAQIQGEFGPNILLVTTSIKYFNNISDRAAVVANYTGRAKALQERFEYEEHKFNQLINFLKKAAQAVSYTIVIRPHPEENASTYSQALASCGNVRVCRSRSVVDWIFAASVVVHNDSSCAVEAAMMGRPVVSLLPYLNRSLSPWMPLKVSGTYRVEDELVDDLTRKAPKHSDGITRDLLRDYFAFGVDSSSIIADRIIATHRERARSGSHSSTSLPKARVRMLSTAMDLKSTLRSLVRGKKGAALGASKLDGLTTTAVREFSDCYDLVHGTKTALSPLGRQLFHLSSRIDS